jgi:hypothetical protein
VLSIAQAAAKRESDGVPLPNMYPALAAREAYVNRGQLTLVVGPPSAGKSLLSMNLLIRFQVPSLAFLLDTDRLTAAARFGAIITGDKFSEVKEDIDLYRPALETMHNMQVVFRAEDLDDIRLQGEAFEQRYGAYPSVVLVDNLGNLTSAMGDEWALLKALTLELDALSKEWQCAIIATAHTTDLTSCEPAQRTAILGKITQYPRLIYSIGYDPETWEYKIAIVKNSSGPSDPQARNPVTLWADTSRMSLHEANPHWTPSGALPAGGDDYPSPDWEPRSVAPRGWSAL